MAPKKRAAAAEGVEVQPKRRRPAQAVAEEDAAHLQQDPDSTIDSDAPHGDPQRAGPSPRDPLEAALGVLMTMAAGLGEERAREALEATKEHAHDHAAWVIEGQTWLAINQEHEDEAALLREAMAEVRANIYARAGTEAVLLSDDCCSIPPLLI